MSVYVLVDGEPDGAVPATDSSVLRGDGCFEAIRSYDGILFRADAHLDRLERSATALEMSLPPRARLAEWAEGAASQGGDCVVRIVVTRGGAIPGADETGRCVVIAHPLPPGRASVALWPVTAPWHSGGEPWVLAGAKTISYAANLSATRQARKEGADDALLVSRDGVILEGPTFALGWRKDSRVFTPSLGLGILDSITRRTVMELWPGIEEVEAPFEEVGTAEEVFAMSTVYEVTPVTSVGELTYEAGPITAEISQRFAALVRQ